MVGGARGVIAEDLRTIANQCRRIAQLRVGIGEDRRHDLGIEGAAEREARDEGGSDFLPGSGIVGDTYHPY